MSFTWTPLSGFSDWKEVRKNLRQGIALILCVFVLSSCGPIKDMWNGNKSNTDGNSPQVIKNNNDDGTAPAAIPAMSIDRPLQPGQSGRPYSADGLPTLQPSKGVNVDALFAAEISDPMQRIQRAENAIIDLRKDFESVLPSILRLVAVEKDIQDLVEQLDTLLRNEPRPAAMGTPAAYMNNMPQGNGTGSPGMASPATASPAALSSVPMQQQYSNSGSSPPQTYSGGANVKGLRLGEHKDKTRIVLDLTGSARYTYNIDNNENILMIELPGTGWSGPHNGSPRSPRIASYNVQSMPSGGSRVIIQLKGSASVINSGSLGPQGGHRIYLDIR